MRRLYIGGLNHTVTQKDLKDRFGKFGEVQDVELRTRRDEEGVPYKTFAYININISEADLKKCMTVLNKSKWKGGTLQIEAAKESFLHRLAQERQEAAEHHLQRSVKEAKKQKLLDTWSKAGVQNFTMKAAVPGSEVPGCKDWVVSKFGRVLPVLQLRCQKGSKARTVKYDPSKYCHNIRKLDRTDPDKTLSVTQLTWQVEGGDDDVSKRRRGEFPPYEPIKPKKSRTDPGDSLDAFSRSRSERAQNSDRNTEVHQLTNGADLPTNHRAAQREERWFLDSDVDSDEEIRTLAAAQQSSHDALQQEAEDDDNLEVVGLDYLMKSGPNDEEDYDSAGTDELFESRRNPPAPPQEKPSSPTAQQFSDKKRQMKRKTTPGDVSSSKNSSSLQRENPAGVRPAIKHSSDSHSDEDDEEEEGNSSDSSSDFDFPALFSANSNHLRISLADLQRLAESKVPSFLGSGLKPESGLPVRLARKEPITPDEILASIMGEDSSSDDKEHKKKKKKAEGVTSASLQPSEETGPETSQTDGCLRRKREHERNEAAGSERQKHGETSEALRESQTNSSSGSEEDEEEEEKMISVEDQPSSSSSSEEEEQEAGAAPPPAPAAGSEEEEEEEVAPPRVALAAKEEEELQRKANMRRLAAVQQRQKEAEEHKKLIQRALANLEAPPPTTGKRIVFGSDDEEEKQEVVKESKKPLFQDSQSEDEATAEGAAAANQNAPHKAERLKPSGPQLFADSEDDEEGGEEEDGSRFDIRPEFEGPAGQKLMALQSRFGTDERFRLDSRFLEEEEEEEETEVQKSLMEDEEALEEEKKKNLSILQSVLGTGQQAGGKTAGKAKQFRDVSALHYDPSKEEHAAFETKTEETKKESKAARRKKREEAQKLPEVSKEIYFQVSGDLKAVFGQTNDGSAEGEEGTNWDEEEEEKAGGEEEQLLPSLLSADPSSKSEESSGFRFSFFGDESAAGSGETAEYKAEKMKAPKVSWHQDPRFHDSSSEEEVEEDEQEEKEEEQSSVEAKNTKEETPSQPDFFFFSSDDHRLTEGPKLFCRTSQLEEQRERWEERTSTLRQEYRKKHRDARRKLNSSRKT
ncbi:nucleolar protein 8 isoform X2 [Gambusia affinis]|uniref:nucleolar protein 8 isoform X2 n=1 Tax=Gambusia affinis TaxID=33528 RepID=UPI001CDCC798|nr:nucleolar protein 8 isoform X2 [Gambusia affinis]